MADLDSLEEASREYAELKNVGAKAKLPDQISKIIDAITSPHFRLDLRSDVHVSENTVSYVYNNSATYPFLFDFLAEILHSKIPIEIENAKFGPGGIIVIAQSKEDAEPRLASDFREFQKLVKGKREQAMAKYQ